MANNLCNQPLRMSSTLVTTSDARQHELATVGQDTNAAVKSKLFNWNT